MTAVDRPQFVDSCRIALDLASSPEVAAAWAAESSCAGMSVGGLAHHLLDQAGHTVRLLGEPATGEQPIPVAEHYRRAAWVTADHDDEVNVDIRESGNARADRGRDAVLAAGAEALAALPRVLDAPRDPDTVLIPWQGWSLTTDDWLVTRSMELLVHADDLASSVGLVTPTFPDATSERVLGLLVGVAARRHGATALLRALSRPQRAPGDVSAF